MRFPLLLTALLSPLWLQAQIDGDNIFSVDQVIMNLDFPQADFWTQLQDNYADQNEYIVTTLTDVSGTHAIDSVGATCATPATATPAPRSPSRLNQQVHQRTEL